jgi:hypothetical protein
LSNDLYDVWQIQSQERTASVSVLIAFVRPGVSRQEEKQLASSRRNPMDCTTKMTAFAVVLVGSLWIVASESQAQSPQQQGYYSYSPQVTRYNSHMVRRAAMAGGAARQPQRKGYPYLGAPLYPCPKQNIPHQIGGTLITNRAFDPHEMLYEHEYRSLYPPYYYKVKGSWLWTPFGIESHDKWELIGTEVNVKYHAREGLFSNFFLR